MNVGMKKASIGAMHVASGSLMLSAMRGVCQPVLALVILALPAYATPSAKSIPSSIFPQQLALSATKEKTSNVSVGDIDGDGHLDIVIAKGRHSPLANVIYFGDGKGHFDSDLSLGDHPDKTYSAILFDLDNDSDLDIVVGNDRSDPNKIFYNTGNRNFSDGGTFGDERWPTRNISVDYIDDDSYPDVVVANRTKQAKSNFVCFGKESGGFMSKCTAISREPSATVIAADVNSDGCKDIVVPHRDGGQSFVYMCTGKRTFEKRIPFAHKNAAIRVVASGDFDNDGKIDISIIDETMGPAILWGTTDEGFSDPQWLQTPDAKPYALATADVNNDDRLDVIVGYVKSKPIVFFNRGERGFHALPFGDENGIVYGFAFGDFNEDSILDVVLARSNAKNIVYFGAAN